MSHLKAAPRRASARRLSTTGIGARRFARGVESVVGAHVSLSKLGRASRLQRKLDERRASRLQRRKIAAEETQRWRARASKLLAQSRSKPPEAVAREQQADRRLLEEAAKADKSERGQRIRVYRGGRADGNRLSKTRFRN